MYNGLGLFSAFSPLNDDPLRGERVKQSPQQFGHNELTHVSFDSVDVWQTPQPVVFGPNCNNMGFMPLQDRDSYAYGKTPDGPWTGSVPDWADYYAFPDISGGLVKIKG